MALACVVSHKVVVVYWTLCILRRPHVLSLCVVVFYCCAFIGCHIFCLKSSLIRLYCGRLGAWSSGKFSAVRASSS